MMRSITFLLGMLFLVIMIIYCSSVNEDYKNAEQTNTVQAFEEFMKKYPNSNFTLRVREKLDSLRYAIVSSKDSIEIYEEFIRDYPNNKFIKTIEERIEELYFQDAKSVNTVDVYVDFTEKYPHSKFFEEAKNSIEQLNFDVARSNNSIQAYEEYINKYPESEFAIKAKERIEQLKRGKSILEISSNYRFYVMPYADFQIQDNLLSYQLWKTEPLKKEDLNLDDQKVYLVGIERDADRKDNVISDFSYTFPTGVTLQNPVLAKSFSTKRSHFYDYGMFFPTNQSDVVWDGLIRWIWEKGIYIQPLEQEASVSFGCHKAKSEQFTQSLIAPILRGSEIETQVVVKEHQAQKVRKIFRLKGLELQKLKIGLSNFNDNRRHQFVSRLVEVADSEQAHPDIEITLTDGSKVKKDFSFNHSSSIRAASMICATLHNSPDFLGTIVSFDGWKESTIKLSAELEVIEGAPIGDHYFRLIHRAEWANGVIYKEQVVRIKIE